MPCVHGVSLLVSCEQCAENVASEKRAHEIVPVVIVQLAGSPGIVFTSLDEALQEVRELVQAMRDDEVMPVPISVRTGTMGRSVLDSLGEFPGY